MRNITKTSELVKLVLEEVPETRNSDDLLYVEVCKIINHVATGMPFSRVVRHRKEYGFPPFESVRRSRQKIQQHYPELAGSTEVEAQREVNEDIVKNYARKVNI